jgi:hypothetical protein
MDQQTMLNFRVPNLDAMLGQLRAAGVTVEDETSEATYGRFGHATDPEGNRFELWEPWEFPRCEGRNAERFIEEVRGDDRVARELPADRGPRVSRRAS